MSKNKMNILGIETSCDNTCICLMDFEKNVIFSYNINQDSFLKQDGGYIPYMLSERHIINLETILSELDLMIYEFDSIAVTSGPGLQLSLFIGASFAKSLGVYMKKTVYYVDHIEAHLLSVMLEHNIEFPFLNVIATGGNFIVAVVYAIGNYKILSRTRDDSPGELLDKIARALDLDAYTGAAVELCAVGGNDISHISITNCILEDNTVSFSGLKTKILRFINAHSVSTADICYSLQHCLAVNICKLVTVLMSQFNLKNICFTGGVASNLYIREALMSLCRSHFYSLFFIKREYCTDNAEMICNLCIEYYKASMLAKLLDDRVYTKTKLLDL